MNVLIINPPRVNGLCVIREDRCEITERESVFPPYSLAQLAAVLRKQGHSVDLVDANCLDLNYGEIRNLIFNHQKLDAVIFRFTPTTFEEDLKVSKITKEINSDTLTIGICWTLRYFAEKILEACSHLDFYIIDEPLISIPGLINSLNYAKDLSQAPGIVYRKDKKSFRSPIHCVDFDYDSIPMPAYDLLPSLDKYYLRGNKGSPYTTIHTSKGCPFGCIYCTVSGTKWNSRSAKTVFEEIEYLYNNHSVKTISFFDETFTFDRDRVIEICNKLIEEKIYINWYCNTRSNKVDLDLLNLMKKAGCKGISLGIESGSQKILDTAKKGTTVMQNEEAIISAKKAGIKTYCSFMFGLPGENWTTARETINFVQKTLPNGAQFNVVVPYPGTKLFDMAISKGWISEDIDWSKLYQHISTIQTDDLDSNELESIRKTAYRNLYFNPKWLFTNLFWVLKNPEDLSLALKYYLNSIKNYLLYDMEHAH